MKKKSFFTDFFSQGLVFVVYIIIPILISYAVHFFLGLQIVFLSSLITALCVWLFGLGVSTLLYNFLNINIEKITQDKVKEKLSNLPPPRGSSSSSQKQKKEEEEIDIHNLPPVEEEIEDEYSPDIEDNDNGKKP